MTASEFRIRPMTQVDAEAIATWRYPGPYSFYDWRADPGDFAKLLDPVQRGQAYWGRGRRGRRSHRLLLLRAGGR